MEKRPFGGDKELYLSYLQKQLKVITFERCCNSIPKKDKEVNFLEFSEKNKPNIPIPLLSSFLLFL